jgi:hypothetical protein
MVNTTNSILCFILAYVIVSLLEVIISIVKIKLFTIKQLDEDLFNYTYKRISFWRPIITIVTFSILGYAYNSSLINFSWITALICSMFWLVLVIIFDLLFKVLLQYYCTYTAEELYKDNMLWTLLTYISVFLGPFIGLLFL